MPLEDVYLITRNTPCHVRCATSDKAFREERKACFQARERRKKASSASVIWDTVLFRQNRTDRPVQTFCQLDLCRLTPSHDKRKTRTAQTEQRWTQGETGWEVISGTKQERWRSIRLLPPALLTILISLLWTLNNTWRRVVQVAEDEP
jgi:hypothetical protein